MTKKLISLFAVIVFGGCATLGGPPEPLDASLQNLPPELQAVATYEFGDSRKGLIAVEQKVRDEAKKPGAGAAYADELVKLLHTSATYAAKDFACRQLVIIAQEDDIPGIARLLQDAETAHMARYALEPMQTEAVDATLIDALEWAPEAAIPGILDSLARRGNSKAAYAIEDWVDHENPDIAKAAQDALSRLQ